MDDSCAVCAEALEWVAYGACGHREVCSTCVARLRFICDDWRCCICKTDSDVVFVTKVGLFVRRDGDPSNVCRLELELVSKAPNHRSLGSCEEQD